jgi:hypothetical protein
MQNEVSDSASFPIKVLQVKFRKMLNYKRHIAQNIKVNQFYLQSFRGWNVSDKVFEESLISFPVDITTYRKISSHSKKLELYDIEPVFSINIKRLTANLIYQNFFFVKLFLADWAVAST